MNRLDVVGKKFNSLTVIKHLGNTTVRGKTGSFAFCQCDCGKYKITRVKDVVTGHTKTCGHTREKHGRSKTKMYEIYHNMKRRCYDKSQESYSRYGERGIKVCERWLNSFKAFCEDMGKRPSNEHTIERIDNSADYAPDNCKWATRKEQAYNRRSNHWITHQGATKTISQWADYLGIKRTTLMMRINHYKWPIEKAFAKNVK